MDRDVGDRVDGARASCGCESFSLATFYHLDALASSGRRSSYCSRAGHPWARWPATWRPTETLTARFGEMATKLFLRFIRLIKIFLEDFYEAIERGRSAQRMCLARYVEQFSLVPRANARPFVTSVTEEISLLGGRVMCEAVVGMK